MAVAGKDVGGMVVGEEAVSEKPADGEAVDEVIGSGMVVGVMMWREEEAIWNG